MSKKLSSLLINNLESVRTEYGVVEIDRGEVDRYEKFVLTPEVFIEAKKVFTAIMSGNGRPLDEGEIACLHRMSQPPYDRMYVEYQSVDLDGRPMVCGTLVDKYGEFVSVGIVDEIGGVKSIARDGFVFAIQPSNLIPPGGNYHPDFDVYYGTATPTILGISILKKLGEEAYTKVTQRSIENTERISYAELHTALFVLFSVIPILNTKSGVTKTVVPRKVAPPGLGKNAARLLSRPKFTVISLSDREDVNSDGVVTSKTPATAHRVRGHFKRKKNGIFWWRPHIRGQGELQQREAYLVQA